MPATPKTDKQSESLGWIDRILKLIDEALGETEVEDEPEQPAPSRE